MKFITLVMLLILSIPAFSNDGTLMIEIAYSDNNQYTLTRAWKVEQNFPPTMNTYFEADDDIIVQLKNTIGSIVKELRIKNPRIIRETGYTKQNTAGHRKFLSNKGSFIVKFTYDDNLQYLNVINANERASFKKQSDADNSMIELDFGSILEY